MSLLYGPPPIIQVIWCDLGEELNFLSITWTVQVLPCDAAEDNPNINRRSVTFDKRGALL